MTVLPLSPPGRKPPPSPTPPPVVVADVPPTPATEHPTVEIPIRLCRASSTQPRRGKLDVASLQEDIRRHGLLQSIWVRTKRYSTPDPVTKETTYYEIAFGHRREYACRLLGWEAIRAEVHDELTDRQVFEMQLSENREHAPLTDLEEADAIALYMRPEAEGGFGVTEVAEVAARLSLSIATVYRRMGLARLGQAGRAALDEGKLYLASAYAIASIRDPAAQDEALKEALDGEVPGAVRHIISLVERRYHLTLVEGHDRPFDPASASLLPGAGACTTCPKRAGAPAQAELFPAPADAVDAEVKAKVRSTRCTDRQCYQLKVAASWELRRRWAAALGLKVIEGQEGHRIVAAGLFIAGGAPGYVCSTSRLTDDPQGRTWGEILGLRIAPSVVVRDASDHVHLLYEQNAAQLELDTLRGKTPTHGVDLGPRGAAARASGGGIINTELLGDGATGSPGSKPGPVKAEPPKKPAVDPLVLERKAEERGGVEALKEIGATVMRRIETAKGLRAMVALAIHACPQGGDVVAGVLEVKGGRKGLLEWSADQKDVETLRGVLVQVLAASHGLFGSEEGHPLVLAARAWDVDLQKLRADALKELKKLAKKGVPIGGGGTKKRAPKAKAAPVPAAAAEAEASTAPAAPAGAQACERCEEPSPSPICLACSATSDVLLEVITDDGPITWEAVIDTLDERTDGILDEPRLEKVRDALCTLGVITYEPGEGEEEPGVYSVPSAPAAAPPPAPAQAPAAGEVDTLAREAVTGLVKLRDEGQGVETRDILAALDGRLPPKRTLATVRAMTAEKLLVPVAGVGNRVRLPVPPVPEVV